MRPLNCPIDEYKRIKMKFNVTKIKFDFDKSDEWDWDSQLTYSEEQEQITNDSLGVWEADNPDDLIEKITSASGWCIKSCIYREL